MGKNILSKTSLTGNKILDGIFFILSGIIVGKLFRKLVFRTSSLPSDSSSERLEGEEERCEETEDEGNNEEVYEETENEISTIDRISKA